jgi:MOSC domain-containing protein YiiM
MGRLIGIARREKKRAPMETLDSAEITMESGVADDFRGKPGNRQVTLLSARAWHEACEALGRPIDWTTRRSNLLVEDMDLPRAAGHIVAIGDVRLETTIEVDPCSRMDEQVDGLTAALKPDWRGGVACKILQGGTVSLGDDVELVE